MKAGRILAIIVIIVIFVYYAIIGLKNKSEKSVKRPVDRVVKHSVDAYQPKNINPTLHILKAGETFEWLFINGRRITIFPDDSGMTFRLYDENKKFIREERRGGNWKEYKPFYISFTTEKQDKKWLVERW